MKNSILLLIALALLSSCATKKTFHSLDEIKATSINYRTDNRYFIPKENYKPLYVRVNMIFLLDENGEGNFNGKDKADNELFDIIYEKANHLYANLVDPKDPNCYKGTDFIKDTKVQLLFNPLYIKDTFARNYRNSKRFNDKKRTIGPIAPSNNWYLKYLDNNINDTISKKGINAFFSMDAKAYDEIVNENKSIIFNRLINASVSQFPSYSNLNRSSQVCFADKYSKRIMMETIYAPEHNISWEKKVRYYFLSFYRGIAHELGHSLGLAHSNKHSQRNKCINAMMYQGFKSKNNYIQPSEIGKIHKALMTSNLIQYVVEDANFGKPKMVSENENWKFKTIRFYQDIIVKEGKVLIFNGKVILPPNASIKLEKNAVLVLNKATLKTATNQPFTNIIKSKHAQIIYY